MLMNTYNRLPVTFVRGEGCRLFDDQDNAYLDFATGIGVNSVGYAHPKWVQAVSDQAARLAHTSNLYHTQPAAQLAERLAALSGLSAVFFANSGAEANEGMIKLARKYSRDKYGEGRHTVVTLEHSFHGRTLTTLSATGQDVFHQHFDPFTPGFIHVPPGDLDALKQLDGGICAVMLEVVQGEGGVLPLQAGYLKEVAKLCAEKDWLLLIDEVQTGIGRTGKWFAFQHTGITPDAVSFAKGIAGGLPLGGLIASQKCAGILKPGDHATTFGGNPVACAAGLAVLDILETFLPEIEQKGAYLQEGLRQINGLTDVRGLGLMLGATVHPGTHGSAQELVMKLLENHLVCLTAGGGSLRLMPPLIISADDIGEGLAVIKRVCESV